MDGAQSVSALISVAVGLGLAAACGFRIFVPLLVASVAGYTGRLPLAGGFEWVGSLPALVAFATATVLEIGAYYVPWLDHALDAVATPAALVAGILASAAVITDLPPLLKWGAALVGGGGVAGLIQGTSVLFRLKSTTLTGGVATTAELIGATGTALLAIFLPLLCLAAVIGLIILAFRATGRLLFGRRGDPA